MPKEASGERRSLSRRFLPRDPRVDEPYRLTPRLALRVGILGMVALGVFTVLFLRLWSLQILNGTQYVRAAQNNQRRVVRIEAPRGPILDRNGRVLVGNVGGTAIQVWPADLPKTYAGRLGVLRRLARVTGVPLAQIGRALREHADEPATPVTIKESVHEPEVSYLNEYRAEFQGVHIAQTFLRHYPFGTLAAQTLGFVGEITAAQLKERRGLGYRGGDEIGQAGVEADYDKYLRGVPGLAHQQVDSLGRPQSAATPEQLPRAGQALRLTLDVDLQKAAEEGIQVGLRAALADGRWAANGGAVVALDPRDGAVRALASYPTYDPSLYAGRVTTKALDAAGLTPRFARQKNYPALNRAIYAAYPPGSTFKPVTALAAMEEHVQEPYDVLQCSGSYERNGQTFKNWDPFVNEPMTMPTAIAASCDTYFYQVGFEFYGLPPERGSPLQAWARRFGFGRLTGIDVGPEASGLLPTPAWRKKTFTRRSDPGHWEIDRLWKPGDSIQLAIGQKDMLATPLQLARFYALIANGGRLVTPHLRLDVEQPGSNGRRGDTLALPPVAAPEPTNVDAAALDVVRRGLIEATHATYGTSSAIFGSFPVAIAGKTGTAEKTVDLGDGVPRNLAQAWWCGYGPVDNPQLVVCALIENGGHGGTSAAPAALKVFEQFFGKQALQQGPVYSD